MPLRFRSLSVLLPPLLLAACSSAEPDATVAPCAPAYASEVLSVSWGSNAGFGQDKMPAVVLGPPRGAGSSAGSTDVASLGQGGEIVLGFAGAIADGPGPDFIVFENAFYAGGDPSKPFCEPGQVGVSEDAIAWVDFPCDAAAPPYDGCAGCHPVFSNQDNGVSAFDPAQAGGEAFDLAQLGLRRARYVRIQDRSQPAPANQAGFDLDAVAVLHPVCD